MKACATYCRHEDAAFLAASLKALGSVPAGRAGQRRVVAWAGRLIRNPCGCGRTKVDVIFGSWTSSPHRAYLPARHFRQDEGRWQSAEPVAHLQPFATYKYAFNSPCTFVDRTGNWPLVFPPNTVWPSDPRWPRLSDAIWVPDPRAVSKKGCIEKAKNNAYIIVGRYIWPKPGGHGGPEDAFRHCVWACLVRKTCGYEAYESGVIDHKRPGAWWCMGKWSPVFSPQDLANDEVGRQCSSAKSSCESCCMDILRSGGLYILPPWFWQ